MPFFAFLQLRNNFRVRKSSLTCSFGDSVRGGFCQSFWEKSLSSFCCVMMHCIALLCALSLRNIEGSSQSKQQSTPIYNQPRSAGHQLSAAQKPPALCETKASSGKGWWSTLLSQRPGFIIKLHGVLFFYKAGSRPNVSICPPGARTPSELPAREHRTSFTKLVIVSPKWNVHMVLPSMLE